MDDPSVVIAAALPDVAALEARVTLSASGLVLYGFDARSDDALVWWRRLAAVSDETGYQPIVVDPDEYGWLEQNDAFQPPEPVDQLLSQSEDIDGEALLRQWGDRSLTEVYGDNLADQIRAQLAGKGDWPDNPVRVALADLTVGWTNTPYATSVLLVPAAKPWQVPCLLQTQGWNGYPSADQHAAILRYFADAYGARLYDISHDGVDLAISRPPADRAAAIQAAWDYECYNDGAYDIYRHENVTALAACLIGADLWRCWWD